MLETREKKKVEEVADPIATDKVGFGPSKGLFCALTQYPLSLQEKLTSYVGFIAWEAMVYGFGFSRGRKKN